jgi:hypothetical protein
MSTLRTTITRLLLTATGVLLVAAPAASATSPTSVLPVTAQAQQANAGFLAYAPPPAAGAGALCLVDTGVNTNPDTTPGLIGSYAIDSGATGDVDPEGHGTTMAMIAGGAGKGILGAWPALKIVSVRATNVPSPGQEPIYEFNYYWDGMEVCRQYASTDHIKAVVLALASQIPPSPDQAQTFATTVGNLEGQNVAVVAAAGNNPGAVEEPATEPNVLAVGADTAQPGTFSDTATGAACSFSANQNVTLYAPGCGLDAADPFSDAPLCCDDGTSEASAFTAAVIVALMSYDPTLTYTKAEQLLVSTANDNDLDVAAAFQADGLGQIVSQGNANTPQPPQPPTNTPTATTTTPASTSTGTGTPASTTGTAKPAYPITIRSVAWRHGVLTIRLKGMRKHATAKVTLTYAHTRTRHASSRHATIKIHTPRPRSAVIRVMDGKTALSATTTVKM